MSASVAATPIYRNQDFYVPVFQVKLQDRKMPADVVRDVQEVTYKDDIQQVDSFELKLNNWDAAARTWKYSDDHLFDPGKRVEVWMGYHGGDPLRLMLKGEITSLRPSFPASGQPTLSVSGLNVLHRMRTKPASHAYPNLKDSEIARQIGGRLGIDVRPDPAAAAAEERIPYLFQDNQYDVIFLMDRARRIGYELVVEESGHNGQSRPSVVHFRPSVAARTLAYQLTYGKSLTQFQPTLTTAGQVGKVVVRGWDPVKKAKIEGTATRKQASTKGVKDKGGEAEIEKAFDEREEIIVNHPIHSKTEAETLARETMERISKDMIKGNGSTVGLPGLRAGCVLMIDGLGTRFSGRYFVTSTTHTIGDGGYTTQFACRREEL